MESSRIEIVEVGPRDGLQSEAQVLSTAAKVEFVRRLAGAGPAANRSGEFREPETGAADGGRRGGAGGAWPKSSRPRALHRPGPEPQRLRSRARRRLCRSGHGDRGQRNLQPAEPGLQRRGGRRSLAGHRRRRARGGYSRADHHLDGFRLSVRRRSAGGPRAGARGTAGGRQSRRNRDRRHHRRGGAHAGDRAGRSAEERRCRA